MSEDVADVLIIGAGASGAAAAWSLAETRMRIVCLEQGDWMRPTDYPTNRLDWEQERLDEAAVLSIYVTRKFPDAPAAERAAQVALAAYEKLYRRARQAEQRDEADFLGGQLADLAKTIASRWPKSPQASTAVELLINIALADDRLAEAEALLARLPEQSKAAAQLSLGGALWRKYRYMTAAGKSSPTEDAAKLAGRAAELMQSGFAGARTNAAPSSALATGVLALAQSALTNGNAETALEALEDARIGPLALLEQGHAAVDRPDLAESIYQTALRTYVSLSPPRREEARRVMSSLEKLTGAGPQLTRMYVNLGFQLQRQIEGMAGAGKYESAREAAAVCEDLLERVSQRADADSWLIRNWVAQTNLQLGELLSDDQRQRYVKRAKEAYEGILATAQRDSQFAPKPGALLAIRKRLADCERGLGNYEKALDQYAAILKQKPTMLPLQQAAAECLQLQGSASKDIAPLKQSIAGAMAQRDGKNLIWGWARLAKQVNHAKSKAEAKLQKDPSAAASVQKYADLYFEARYNVAKSRFLMAKVGPPVQRRDNLQAAKRSVTSMQALYPNLGGPKWKAAFEKLLGEIEQASG